MCPIGPLIGEPCAGWRWYAPPPQVSRRTARAGVLLVSHDGAMLVVGILAFAAITLPYRFLLGSEPTGEVS